MSAPSLQPVLAEIEALLERRRTAQAKLRLKEALQHYPDHPELLLQSAWADYMVDDNAAALVTVRQVLSSVPENRSARRLLFALLVEKNKLAEAEQVIVQLLHDYPEHAPYYAHYAELMIRTMNLAKARALADEGCRYDADNADCLAARAVCDFAEQPSGSSSYALQQLLVRYPQATRTLLLILTAMQDRGDHRAALQIAQQLVQAQPDNEHFAELAASLKATTHWSMLPLWPVLRWGWGASIAFWLLGNAAVRIVAPGNPVAAITLAICMLAYVVYSWAWPPLLRRWIARA